jgi:ribonuclease VapC
VIVDASAIVAILKQEHDGADFAAALESGSASVSTATLLETYLVGRPQRDDDVDELVEHAQLEIVPFDAEQLRVARDAHARYGRGSGSPARLNLGDCISYALAKVRDEPLLFKGEDFTHTDVVPAYRP